jgi:hypothetical protein
VRRSGVKEVKPDQHQVRKQAVQLVVGQWCASVLCNHSNRFDHSAVSGRGVPAVDKPLHEDRSCVGSPSPFAHGRESSGRLFRDRPRDRSDTVHMLAKVGLLQRLPAALDHFSEVAVRLRDRERTLNLQRQPHDSSVRQGGGIDDHVVKRFAEVGLLLGDPLHNSRVEGRRRRAGDHGREVLRRDSVFVGKSGTASEFRRSHALSVSLVSSSSPRQQCLPESHCVTWPTPAAPQLPSGVCPPLWGLLRIALQGFNRFSRAVAFGAASQWSRASLMGRQFTFVRPRCCRSLGLVTEGQVSDALRTETDLMPTVGSGRSPGLRQIHVSGRFVVSKPAHEDTTEQSSTDARNMNAGCKSPAFIVLASE